MTTPYIEEIKSDKANYYKNFLKTGLLKDEDSFRLTANDDLETPFPTKDNETALL